MTERDIQRVRIYLRQDERWQGEARYLAILEELRRLGATGATVLHGLAGFGPGHRVRPAPPERPDRRQPVVIEWVDRAERVTRLLPLLDELLGDALVTLEDVTVYRGRLRTAGPFAAEQTVGDVMRSPAPAVAPTASLREVVATMQAAGVTLLPVQEADGRLAGVITAADLTRRLGMRVPLSILARLTPTEQEQALASLADHTAGDIMRTDSGNVHVGAAIPQAIISLIEWGYDHLPVIDRTGRLVGLIGQEEILGAAVADATTNPRDDLHDAEPPAGVTPVLQPAVTIRADQGLDRALAMLLTAPEQRLLVVDAERVVGTLDLGDVLQGLTSAERTVVVDLLRRSAPTAPRLPGATRRCADVCAPAPPEALPTTSLIDAARRLLDAQTDRLAVVDAERRLLGIIGRGGLIRALLQQSEAI